MARSSERYHALDTLRAVAMFLGIALHAFLAYTTTPIPFWPVRDPSRTFFGDVFVYAVHEFRMQTFFLLAGFFGCLIYQRYQLTGMLWHRFQRIVIPLILACFTIQPLLQLLWFYGDVEALKFIGMPRPDLNQPTRVTVGEYVASLEFLEHIRPAHLWFLEYLLFCFAMMIPFLVWKPLTSESRLGQRLDSWFIRLLSLRGRSFLLGAMLLPSVWISYRWAIDTPDRWLPRFHIVFYYFLFFGFGWLLYRHRDRMHLFTQSWRPQLLISNLVILPAQLMLIGECFPGMSETDPYPEGKIHYKIVAVLLGSAYTWMMVAGLTGLFLHCFNRESRAIRYLADASYWCYLMHLIPVIILQLILRQFSLPGEVKWLLVLGISTLFLLVTYDRFVRYTYLGWLLNGKKRERS